MRYLTKHLPRRLPYFLAGLGALTLVVLAFRPAPIPVDLGEVERGELQVTVDAEGKTRVQDRFVVAAPVAGRLDRIDLDEGDPVEQGKVVARIDPLPLDTQVREAQARLRELQAEIAGVETQRPKPAALIQSEARIRAAEAERQATEAEVEKAEAALQQARRDRIRAQDLETTGAISRQRREEAELLETSRTRELKTIQRQLEGAIAEVAAAREELSILQAEQRDPDYLVDAYRAQIAAVEAELTNLADEASRTEIQAPVTGYVLRVLQESARFVAAGDPLIELGDPSDLELVIDVLSTDAVKVQPGASILVEHWGGETTLMAEVRYVEPAAFTEVSALGVEEQRVNIIGDFVDPSVPLGDGYRIEARIVVWRDDDVLKAPVSALFRCGEGQCVFVAENGRAHQREVVIGRRNEFEVVIKQGLETGEQVILHPTEQIEAGRRIGPR
ncbi:MAG: efflux RND transporter periplasmic adaptor subunit [Pseudanabaenales cyanobacterium]|nr:efflux RND transporter periplasmic adaptor subunit [Pseudanabaenales cyanobacterium]